MSPYPQYQNYSFIDDLRGAIAKQSGQAAAYQDQQDDLRMKLATIRETASPEVYASMKGIYGDRFPDLFEAPHALDYLRSKREQFDNEAEQLNRPSPIQLQAGASALGVGPRPVLPPIGPTAQTFMQPRPPMALPAFEPMVPQAPPPAPVSPTLQMAAGALPEPTESNPFGRLFAGTTEVLKGQDALANRANPALPAAQQLALDTIMGKKRKRNSELLAESKTPVAGRGYVTQQEQAAAALDQKLSKMGIEDIMALIKVAGAVNKDTSTTGKIVNEQGKLIQGEAREAQKPRNAALMSGRMSESRGRDQWLDSMKVKISSAEKQLAQAQGELGKMGAFPLGAKKARKIELENAVKALAREIEVRKEAITERFGE